MSNSMGHYCKSSSDTVDGTKDARHGYTLGNIQADPYALQAARLYIQADPSALQAFRAGSEPDQGPFTAPRGSSRIGAGSEPPIF